MNKNKIIQNKFKSWGINKKEIPSGNEVLKREIISRFPTEPEKIISSKHSPLIWLPLTFTAMAVFVLFVNFTGYSNNVGKQDTQTQLQTEPAPTSDIYKSTVSTMPFYREEGSSISDTREFLKVNYNASLRTRNVSDLRIKVESIIRNLGGRIDYSNSGEKNGYINFVIPKSNLESLKIGVKDLVWTKFYNEQINSQNLLSEKQIIEENQKQTETKLNNSQMERAQIIGNHNSIIASYKGEILIKNTEINTLNMEYQYANMWRKSEITNRVNQLQTEINAIQAKIENENRSYQEKINNINSQIKNIQENLGAIKIQDANLLDNVATVNGTISLSWISLWAIADAYVPGALLVWVLFLVAFASFLWYRHSMRVSYNSLDFS